MTVEYWLTNSIYILNAIPGNGYNLGVDFFLLLPPGGPVILWPNFLVHKVGGSHISPIRLPVLSWGPKERVNKSMFVNCKLPVQVIVVCMYHPNSLSPSDYKSIFGLCCFLTRAIFQNQPASLISWLVECIMVECVKRYISVNSAAQFHGMTMLCCYSLGHWVAFIRLAQLKTRSIYQINNSISYDYVLGLKTETCLLNLKRGMHIYTL